MSVEGVDELKKNLEAFRKSMDRNVANAILKGARLVQNTTIKRIQKPAGIGIWVTRYQPGQAPYEHLASAPGQSPNTDTGELVRGIQIEVRDGDVYVGVESSQDQKALALEFGNEKGTLLPRPFLNPSLEENRAKIRKLIQEAAEKSAEEGNKKIRKQLRKQKKQALKTTVASGGSGG